MFAWALSGLSGALLMRLGLAVVGEISTVAYGFSALVFACAGYWVLRGNQFRQSQGPKSRLAPQCFHFALSFALFAALIAYGIGYVNSNSGAT